jgi:hypothetical protein
VHRLLPRLVLDHPCQLDQQQDHRECRRNPRYCEQHGEDPAGAVVPAPVEVGPIAVGDACTGEEEYGQQEEADKGVEEGVEDGMVMAVVDCAEAVREEKS